MVGMEVRVDCGDGSSIGLTFESHHYDSSSSSSPLLCFIFNSFQDLPGGMEDTVERLVRAAGLRVFAPPVTCHCHSSLPAVLDSFDSLPSSIRRLIR